MTLFQDNISPYISFVEGAAPGSPAATNFRLYYDSADHLLKWKNSAGTVTTVATGQSGIPSGTSNPGSPATNDLFFRTDLGMIFKYNGTRWLCICPHETAYTALEQFWPLSASGGLGYAELDNSSLDLWCTKIACSTTTLTTNNGTNFWTVSFSRGPSSTSLGSFTTGSGPDTAGTNTRHDVTVNALLGTSDRYLTGSIAKTLSPGSIYVIAKLIFWYVAA